MNTIEINNDFWFLSKNKSSISHLKKGLDLYATDFQKASNLDSHPIFLDANVLLYFYKVSNKVKQNFIDFLNKNIDDIFITEHVKNEYLKSRVKVINNDYLNVLKDTPDDLQKNLNILSSFITSNKAMLNDYGDIYDDLKEIEGNLLNAHKKLTSEIKQDLERNKNIKYNDPLLDVYSNITVINNISDKEASFIKGKYDELKNNSSVTFPGMADDKKTNNHDGDFIIFHELMKYMKENDTSIIFLTNDIKEDWFYIDSQKKKSPQISYIEATYNNTGRFNYILEANRTLSELLDIKITSNIYQKKREKQEKILREKSFSYSWVDDLFSESFNNFYLDIFSRPITYVEIEYGVDLSNIDFDTLLDGNHTTADFHGYGIAAHRSTDDDDNEVVLQSRFTFYGNCEINNDIQDLDILELDIDEEELEVT